MGSKPSLPHTAELCRPRLDEQINMKHPLVKLAALIDWPKIERTFALLVTSARGQPALPSRLRYAAGAVVRKQLSTARVLKQAAGTRP